MSKRLIVVHDSEIIRRGLSDIVRSAGIVDSIEDAVCIKNLNFSFNKSTPTLLIIDPLCFQSGGFLLSKRLKKAEVKVIAIVKRSDELIDYEMFDEVIDINDQATDIVSKLRVLISDNNEKHSESDSVLSAREIEIVGCLARGFSNKEISEQLFISIHTVITHRKNISRKLNIKSVAGLILYAIINEIVSVNELRDSGKSSV